jgi:hypothetical protein
MGSSDSSTLCIEAYFSLRRPLRRIALSLGSACVRDPSVLWLCSNTFTTAWCEVAGYDHLPIPARSVATNTPIREYAACVDTVSLCLSKTLGAPVGSVLVGPQSVIDRVCIVWQ